MPQACNRGSRCMYYLSFSLSIYIYICICVYIYIERERCIHIHVNNSNSNNTLYFYVHVCICIYIYTHTRIYIYIYIYIYIHTYICVYYIIYIYTHIHTYTYARHIPSCMCNMMGSGRTRSAIGSSDRSQKTTTTPTKACFKRDEGLACRHRACTILRLTDSEASHHLALYYNIPCHTILYTIYYIQPTTYYILHTILYVTMPLAC